jgi:imidazolonepropionase-like amidohydrolase
MKLGLKVFTAILMAFASIPAALADYLITDVTVLSMDGGKVFKNATVRVNGDRITAIIEGKVSGSFKGTLIDGTGKFLIPGLAEMHGHLPSERANKVSQAETLFLYISQGVTTVRGMLGADIQFKYRDEINRGKLAGPNLYLAAPSLNGSSVSSVAEGIQKIEKYAGENWDLQKIHPGLSLDEFNAIAKRANELKFPFGGHVPADVGILRALEVGQASIDHMDGYMIWLKGDTHKLTKAELDKAVQVTKDSGTWIVPTQELWDLFYRDKNLDDLLKRSELKYMPESVVNSWFDRTKQSLEQNKNMLGEERSNLHADNRQTLLKAMADGGVNIALGSDAPQMFSVPGFSILREIEIMRDAGLTADQILDIGTRAPGVYFADKDKFGMVKKGYRADFILLNKDPREDIMNIADQAGVMVQGRWYSADHIAEELAKIEERHKR